ncbi:MAG TPA: serine/threonine-protein kinase, partial [Janthinobacterium sp.]|nr:serine/threonine-protein kinase [Janthinobacterium sp.]
MSARYHILEYLGATAGSQLYRGRCRQDDAPVLLKVPYTTAARPAQAASFQREYDALLSPAMPGRIPPIALVNDDGRPLMVLQDVAGGLLESLLDRQGLDVPACLRLGSQLAQIAGALHAAHIIHRDIRPANFMLDIQQQLRLLDLSQAAFETQEVAVPGNDLPRDWAYVSPEQTGRMNRPLDYRSDFYSLGVMLYRMLTGQLPFAAGDPVEWTHCHIARSPSPPRSIASEIPPVVAD